MMKILLATDGSNSSRDAATMLARLPHREKFELIVATAITPPATAFFSPTREFMQQLVEEDRKDAATYQQQTREIFAGANASCETVLLDGVAEEAIIEHAKSQHVELIVMGAKGHSQVDRILLGSTSDFVATHAHCSVLVVRSKDPEPISHPTLRVAVAYDASPASQSAVEELLKLDWGVNTELTVVGVAGYSPTFDPEFGFNPSSIRAQAKDSLHEATERLRPRVHRVKSRLIEHDHVAEGLVRFTEEEHVGCMVIGETDRSTLARALLGSVSRFVLRHARCGVWISRSPRRAEAPGIAKEHSSRLAGAN
jgi:nucleotide-binding universal stress UspA family protein